MYFKKRSRFFTSVEITVSNVIQLALSPLNLILRTLLHTYNAYLSDGILYSAWKVAWQTLSLQTILSTPLHSWQSPRENDLEKPHESHCILPTTAASERGSRLKKAVRIVQNNNHWSGHVVFLVTVDIRNDSNSAR